MAKFNRFDFKKDPKRFKKILRPIASMLANPAWRKYKPIVHYNNAVENIKAPFLLLCNHNAFLDFKIVYKLIQKHNPNFVVALDGFVGKESLMRNVGCIAKRKFTNDITLIRQLKKVIDRGDVPALYPEARYSLCGTTAVLPESLGKMIKLFKVPVVVLISHGHHINSPFWDTSHERNIPYLEEDFSLLFTKDDIEKLSTDEINEKLVAAFQYDDFKWQKENKIIINDPNRADGLEKVLYQCPNCKTEYKMSSNGYELNCLNCNKTWIMDEYGSLQAKDGKTEFSHIPDWYEWERSNVRKEVRQGKYSTGLMPVTIRSLPNAKKYINLGEGKMIHDQNGFKVTLDKPIENETATISRSVLESYSIHIEYRHFFKYGDCIDISSNDDTWFVYPHDCDFSATKIALATEELYQYEREKINKPCKKGLA